MPILGDFIPAFPEGVKPDRNLLREREDLKEGTKGTDRADRDRYFGGRSFFKVTIHSTMLGDFVEAWLPEEFQIRVESNWTTFPNLATFLSISGMEQILQQFGYSGQTKEGQRQYWKGNTPLSFQLELNFWAIQDALYDVELPLRKLLFMTSPSAHYTGVVEGLFDTATVKEFTSSKTRKWGIKKIKSFLPTLLRPPGINARGVGDHIDIYIGNNNESIYRNVIITGYEASRSSAVNSKGWPMFGRCGLTLSTRDVITKGEVLLDPEILNAEPSTNPILSD